ncbi:hypothetical protein KQI86_06170 [Clostridium sp. MSJ-11]|uniref:DUF3159 domain-containing protein n=1 Tax=Clostridium mobile TaxID=2841512 RepID=A0ABS6EFB4_9CLOT|nr:DUF6773 family protein [Clostridium mobile]MBU5483908.1 hypothetical protein [Clostridium mobile]
MIKKLKDERIIKETNKISSPLYLLILILTVTVAVTKYIFFTQELSNYILEIAAITVSMGYLISNSLINGIPIFSSDDECINELQNKYRARSFEICFYTYVFGEFIALLVPGQALGITALYILIWIVPSAIFTVKAVKRGLLIWGGENRKKKTIVDFKKRVILGSLFYGTFMRWEYLWEQGKFQPMEILKILGAAAMWGIPFYFTMKLIISNGEKKSNKELEE